MIQRYIVVACDFCPEEATPRPTVKGARKQALEDGFVHKKGRDICPICQKKEVKDVR